MITNRPIPTITEKHVYGSKSIMCKTDTDGFIEYANEYFVELTEYNEGEIMGENIELIRHPEMPKVIINKMWNQVKSKKKANGIVKFLSKTGSFFWLQVKFDFKVDEITREISNVYLYATSADRMSIIEIDKFYEKLNKIEKESGIKIATNYFNGYLENSDLNFETFTEKFIKN